MEAADCVIDDDGDAVALADVDDEAVWDCATTHVARATAKSAINFMVYSSWMVGCNSMG